MTKKSFSFLMMICIVFGTMFTLTAQEDDSYLMWESIMLTPDNTKLKVLSDNMRKHNETYHKEGAYHATVFNIVSGPNSGKIVWMMGPMTYSHNDTRPSDGGHDEDWRDNVMPYIKKMNTIEYWKQDNELSNTSMLDSDPSKYPIIFVRYNELEPGKGSFIKPFYKKVSKVVKSMEGDNPWGLYYNEFIQGDLGRHIASVSFYKNWSEFDEDDNFQDAFKKEYGDDSWDTFLDLASETFSNTWDEIWNYNKHMSGD